MESVPIRRFIAFSLMGTMLGRGASLPGGGYLISVGGINEFVADLPDTMCLEWLDPLDDERWPERLRSQKAAMAARMAERG